MDSLIHNLHSGFAFCRCSYSNERDARQNVSQLQFFHEIFESNAHRLDNDQCKEWLDTEKKDEVVKRKELLLDSISNEGALLWVALVNN